MVWLDKVSCNLDSCPFWLPITVIKIHDQKQLGEEGVSSPYGSPSQSITEGTRARWEPGAGAEAKSMDGCCLLACSPWLGQLPFLNHPEHLPRRDHAHSGRGPPHQSLIDLPMGQFDGGNSSTDASSSQMTTACVKLIKKSTQHSWP